jgi:hypothetical protein
LHGGQKRFNLLEIFGRGFSLAGNISNENLKLASPLTMVVLQLGLPLGSLALVEEEVVGKLFDGIIILLTFSVFIEILKLCKLAKFLLNLIFLSMKLLLQFFGLNLSLVSRVSLSLDFLLKIISDEFSALLKHGQPLLRLLSLLLKVRVSIVVVIIFSFFLKNRLL